MGLRDKISNAGNAALAKAGARKTTDVRLTDGQKFDSLTDAEYAILPYGIELRGIANAGVDHRRTNLNVAETMLFPWHMVAAVKTTDPAKYMIPEA